MAENGNKAAAQRWWALAFFTCAAFTLVAVAAQWVVLSLEADEAIPWEYGIAPLVAIYIGVAATYLAGFGWLTTRPASNPIWRSVRPFVLGFALPLGTVVILPCIYVMVWAALTPER